MDCRNISEVSRIAATLYAHVSQVPFMVKFVVFAKILEEEDEECLAKLSVFCMTDDKEEKTLEQKEGFIEIARSRDVEVLEHQDIFVEMSGGNLQPILKSGEQLKFKFHAFRENRLAFMVHVKANSQPNGRLYFLHEPTNTIQQNQQQHICLLDITLDRKPEMNSSSSLCISSGRNFRDLINAEYKLKYNSKNIDISNNDNKSNNDDNEPYNDELIMMEKCDIRLMDISENLGKDWETLATKLSISAKDIDLINSEYSNNEGQCAYVMLRLWLQNLQQLHPENETNAVLIGQKLQSVLNEIGRSDIVERIISNNRNALVHDEFKKPSTEIVSCEEEIDVSKNSTTRNGDLH